MRRFVFSMLALALAATGCQCTSTNSFDQWLREALGIPEYYATLTAADFDGPGKK